MHRRATLFPPRPLALALAGASGAALGVSGKLIRERRWRAGERGNVVSDCEVFEDGSRKAVGR